MNYSHLEQYDLYSKQRWTKTLILSWLVSNSLCDPTHGFIPEIISMWSRAWRKQTSSAQSYPSVKANQSQSLTKPIAFRIREEDIGEVDAFVEGTTSVSVFNKTASILRKITCLVECVCYKWLAAVNTQSQPAVLPEACAHTRAHTHVRAGGPPPPESAKSLPRVSSEVCFASKTGTTHAAPALLSFVLKSIFRY